MNKTLFALFLLSPLCAFATEQSSCTANKGTYLTGTVTTSPKFQAASETLSGIKLSHTVLNIKADQDGKTYQVAMDNVYASDYVKNSSSMPASLAALKSGTRIEVCGEKYSDGTGIHWVHDNCGDTPSASAPNGWTKTISSSGTIGANLEGSTSYCYLWD